MRMRCNLPANHMTWPGITNDMRALNGTVLEGRLRMADEMGSTVPPGTSHLFYAAHRWWNLDWLRPEVLTTVPLNLQTMEDWDAHL